MTRSRSGSGARFAAAPRAGLPWWLPWWLRRAAAVAIDGALAAAVLFLVARLPALWFAPLGTLGAVVVYLGVAGYYAVAWARAGRTLGERLAGLRFTPEEAAPGWGSAIRRALFQALLLTGLGGTAAWSRWFQYEPGPVRLGQVLLLGIIPAGQLLIPLLRADRRSLIDLITGTRVLAPGERPAAEGPGRRGRLAWGAWGLAALAMGAWPLAQHSEEERALMMELGRSRGVWAARIASTPLAPEEAARLGEGDALCVTLWVEPLQIAKHWAARARAHHERPVRRVSFTVRSGPFVDSWFPSGTWRGTVARPEGG